MMVNWTTNMIAASFFILTCRYSFFFNFREPYNHASFFESTDIITYTVYNLHLSGN